MPRRRAAAAARTSGRVGSRAGSTPARLHGSAPAPDPQALMRVDLFDFDLPADRIALRPARPRDSARMLLVEGERLVRSRRCSTCRDMLRPGDVLVFNDTRVIPAQLEGTRGEARIGATLHKREGLRSWWAFVRNAKRVRDGDVVDFGEGVAAIAVERDEDGAVLLAFPWRRAGRAAARARRADAAAALYRLASAAADAADRDDYQTMFARGSRRGRRADRRAAFHRPADRGARRARASAARR